MATTQKDHASLGAPTRITASTLSKEEMILLSKLSQGSLSYSHDGHGWSITGRASIWQELRQGGFSHVSGRDSTFDIVMTLDDLAKKGLVHHEGTQRVAGTFTLTQQGEQVLAEARQMDTAKIAAIRRET
jgi:hypothetical protein